MIVSQLHRSKMDPNRERDEACQGDFKAEYSFDTYHGLQDQCYCLISFFRVFGYGEQFQRVHLDTQFLMALLWCEFLVMEPFNSSYLLNVFTYSRFIQKAHNLVKRTGQPGIHFDIHGYSSHSDLWFELGYLIDNDDLDDGRLRRFENLNVLCVEYIIKV